MADIMVQLIQRIGECQRENAARRSFVPETLFNSIMTDDVIQKSLKGFPDYEYRVEDLANRISTGGTKVFGILLLNNQTNLLPKFVERKHLDAKLPFSVYTLTKTVQISEEEAQKFERKQWEFIAPTFSREIINSHFEKDTILPFVEDRPLRDGNSNKLAEGKFGSVHVVRLSREHQDGEEFPERFARKAFKLDPKQAENHKKELENFSILNNVKHPNILELLASYTIGRTHNLLFPLADDGTLSTLLKSKREATSFVSDEALLIAMAGLASAVEHVHNFTSEKLDLDLMGCHHDLRPRNVLVCGSKFILADFGLAQFHGGRFENPGVYFSGGMDDFIAPERKKSRSSDIWSFGCILTELAAYTAQGHEGVKSLRKERRFEDSDGMGLSQFHCGSEGLNPGVDTWLSSNLERPPMKTWTCTLLAWLIRSSLCMTSADRLEAKDITWRLRLLALHEVTAGIDDLFQRVRDRRDDPNLVLEHTRFDSWRDAIKVRDPRSKFKSRWEPKYGAMDRFDAILESLSRLRKDLEIRLSDRRTTKRLNLSRLLQLNDELDLFLSEEQKIAARHYFKIKIVEEGDQLLDQREDEKAGVALGHEIRMRTTIRNMSRLLGEGGGTVSRELLIRPEDVRLEPQKEWLKPHNIGKLVKHQDPEERFVWVEWRKYDKSGANKQHTEILHDRTAAIARFLSEPKPDDFRTLKCCGYYHEPLKTTFGLLFEVPGNKIPDSPTTLGREIINSMKEPRNRPDLEDRYKLASSLAATILELHNALWLHKNLTASNVLFFPQSAKDTSFFRKPFLVGFNHGRRGDPSAFTTGAPDDTPLQYMHPTYAETEHGFLPIYDYYSLGIILLEIGLWRPVKRLEKRKGKFDDPREYFLSGVVPLLPKYMGRGYCEAVRCCIECDFGDAHGTMEQRLLFKERVVDRLNSYCTLGY